MEARPCSAAPESARPRRGGRRRTARALLLAAGLGLVWAAPGRAAGPPASPAEGGGAAAPGLAYTTELVGVDDPALRELLEQSSQLRALAARPPVSVAGLRRRIADDVERFRTALRSEGYYDGRIATRTDAGVTPAKVTVEITPGPRYSLGAYAIEYTADGGAAGFPATAADAGLRLGAPARAPAVLDAQRRVLRLLGQRGRPFARIQDTRNVVDHATRSLDVTLTVDPGPAAAFGPVRFEGLETVEEAYVRRLVRWREGEPYDQRKADAYQSALHGTRLFASVNVSHPDAPEADGTLPIAVRVTEAKPRTIGAGVSYSSSEGFGAEAHWEHRNLLGANERLRISASLTELEQSATVEFRKPHWRRLDQALILRGGAVRTESEAFDERTFSVFAGVERTLNDWWRVSGGVSFERTTVEDNTEKDTFLLVGLPLAAVRDTSDDPLNPTEGTRLRFATTPYAGGGDEQIAFWINEITGAAYRAVADEDRVILAGRFRVGSIAGQSTDNLPSNKRFYAGGGGSVRGYEYQTVGPLDAVNDPVGGRSVVELSGEVRVRVTDRIGVVPFIDGGQVFDRTYPDFSDELLWAGGIGLRYYSPLGPLRFDVAFPLNGRDGVDDSFEFYISLGQAF